MTPACFARLFRASCRPLDVFASGLRCPCLSPRNWEPESIPPAERHFLIRSMVAGEIQTAFPRPSWSVLLRRMVSRLWPVRLFLDIVHGKARRFRDAQQAVPRNGGRGGAPSRAIQVKPKSGCSLLRHNRASLSFRMPFQPVTDSSVAFSLMIGTARANFQTPQMSNAIPSVMRTGTPNGRMRSYITHYN